MQNKDVAKYLIVIFTLITLACLMPHSTALAFDSGNYTSVDIIFSDNLTIAGDNLSMEIVDLDTIVSDSVDGIIDKANSWFLLVFEFVLIFCLAILGYWKHDRALLMIAGFGFVIYGFTLWTTLWWLSIITVIAGIYLVIKAFWGRSKED